MVWNRSRRVDVVGLRALAGHAHHQHEVHEPVGGVAGQVQAVQRHLGAGSPRCRRWRSTRPPCGRTPGRGRAAPNWRGPPSSSDRWPVPMIATRWSLGHDSTSSPDGLPELRRTASAAAAAARRCWCRSARSAGRPAGRSVMIGQVMLWSIRSSLLKARSKPASRPSRRMCADRSSSPAQRHPRQPELALLVVPVGVVERRLADEELRHVVQPQLVEVVAADHDQHVGPGPGQRLAEALDLGDPLVGERRPVLAGRRARAVVERVVRRGDDGDDRAPCRVSSSVGQGLVGSTYTALRSTAR